MQYNWPLIGHDNIKAYFTRAFSMGRIHHAYLFEGLEHVGKATFARMLASTILCESETVRPCNVCRACRQILCGAHPDLLMLTKKEEEDTTISIDAMREYIGVLQTRPLLASRRVGIMEEAEL